VKDVQLSPAEAIIRRLEQLQANLRIFDPYFKGTEMFSHKIETDLISTITNADAAIIITAHNEFCNIEPSLFVSKMKTPIVVDSRGIIELKAAKKAGLILKGIGRGGI
jgi:UDP-N-acetyl-D-mannosaminuronate dehydrogenase